MDEDETVWIETRRSRPDDDELYLVKDDSGEYALAHYEQEDRLWYTEDFMVVDAVKYMRIPEDY